MTARLTMPRLAADIRTYLDEGDFTMALRWVAQAVTDVRSLTNKQDIGAFFSAPETTGSTQWDTLIAGVAEREARRAGVVLPSWCISTGPLVPFWFVTRTPGLEAYALAHTPTELRIRGVFLDAAELESV